MRPAARRRRLAVRRRARVTLYRHTPRCPAMCHQCDAAAAAPEISPAISRALDALDNYAEGANPTRLANAVADSLAEVVGLYTLALHALASIGVEIAATVNAPAFSPDAMPRGPVS